MFLQILMNQVTIVSVEAPVQSQIEPEEILFISDSILMTIAAKRHWQEQVNKLVAWSKKMALMSTSGR